MTMLRRIVLSLVLAGCGAAATANRAVAPPEHRRGPEQTFLTFPEWYLVHSPAEYAEYLHRGDPPSRFPLFAHIGQFWQGYAAVTAATADAPFNAGYHGMVFVIGTSTSVEYALKGVYERTVGRVAEALSDRAAPTPEDRFAAQTAQEYVDFIRVDPWYLFDFGARLKALWRDVPLRGDHLLRRWERRYALSTEYLVKDAYARLIKLATQTIYDAPKPVTAVVLDRLPASGAAAPPEMRLLRTLDDGAALVTLPRYEAFTACAAQLAAAGVNFREVAGNHGPILVSLIADAAWQPSRMGERVLFKQPILTRPGQQRVVLVVPVAGLGELLRAQDNRVTIEHVYDY
jgi:hypothetical protein